MKKKRKLGRKLLSFLLTLAMVVGLMPGMGLTAYAASEEHIHGDNISFTAWDGTTSLPDNAGSYYLTADVTLSSEWSVPSGETNLCLNGHSVRNNGSFNAEAVIKVGDGASLKLYNDSESGSVICSNENFPAAAVCVDGGTFNMYGGVISSTNIGVIVNTGTTFNLHDGKIRADVTGVDLNSQEWGHSEFNMFGGTITGATGYNGVCVSESTTFTITGGSIAGNNRGVHVRGGAFIMKGGDITGNSVSNDNGGGVYVESGTFTMQDGSIAQNSAESGGGVFVDNSGTFNMKGGSIGGNTAVNGGGIYAYGSEDEYDDQPKVNLTDGRISGNNATTWGGGVYGAEYVYLSGCPYIEYNYINGALEDSVYVEGNSGINNNLCFTDLGFIDNYKKRFKVNGELDGARVGISLPTELLGSDVTFPLTLSRGFGSKAYNDYDDADPIGDYYNSSPKEIFFFDLEGYEINCKKEDEIDEVSVGLTSVDYNDYVQEYEINDYNIVTSTSSAQDWSAKKEHQVVFGNSTVVGGNIKVKNSGETKVVLSDYSEGSLTVNGRIYSEDGEGKLCIYGRSHEYFNVRVKNEEPNNNAINIKNIYICGVTLELDGGDGNAALGSDTCISSPVTYIYESNDGINYTYHPYTSGATTPIGEVKRYVRINNTEPEWVAEVTSGDNTNKYVDFANALTAWKSESGKTLKLLKDVTTTDSITVTGGTSEAPLVLDLNGHGIMYTETGKAPVITVDNGGVLNLSDSYTTKKHYITLTSGRGTAVSDANSDGAIEVTGGYITGGTGFEDGSTLRGGGVLVKNGTFTISGGTIVGNNAKDGGGVSVAYNSNFTMNGGSIYYNTASENAGGVYAYGVEGSNKASVIINEGNIVKNTAQLGGGVCIGYLGAFTMNGGKIEGNTATIAGGGVVQNGNEYEFAVNGGSITENKAMSLAGGIACGAPFNLSGGVIITGNKVGDEDGNVYLIEDGAITLTGALSDTASIGVSMQTPGVFTSSTGEFKAKDYSSCFFSDNSEYIVKTVGDELKLSTHEHSFTYSAKDGTITATCNDQDGCPLAGSDYKATLTISANGGTYDGTTSYEATVTDENSIKGEAVVNYYKATDSGERGEALSPLTTAPVNAGRYWAEITLGTGEDAKTAHVVYTIEKAAETAPAADTNQLNINYPDETISAKPGYEVASDDNGTEITDFSSILDETTPTVYQKDCIG